MSVLPYKPVIYSAPTFDVTEGCTITFTYLGGIIKSNTITFRNNSTNAVVYTQTTVSNQLKCVIPANASGLANGTVYNISITVTETTNDTSQPSDTVIIYCFSTPTFTFSAPTNNSIVPTSYVEAIVTYSQAQNEPLDRYSFTLYDINGQQKSFSGDLYNTTTLSYVFYNLLDNEGYSIKATGVTQHNIVVEANINFTINYEEPSIYSFLGLENVPEADAIKIAPNIIVAEGKAYPNPPTFIDNSAVDLTQQGSYVEFNNGFTINDNFVIQMIGSNFTPFTHILTMANNVCKILVEYRTGNFASWSGEGDCGYFELKVGNNTARYVGISNYFDVLTSEDVVFIWIRHYNGAFEIQAEILEQEGEG